MGIRVPLPPRPFFTTEEEHARNCAAVRRAFTPPRRRWWYLLRIVGAGVDVRIGPVALHRRVGIEVLQPRSSWMPVPAQRRPDPPPAPPPIRSAFPPPDRRRG